MERASSVIPEIDSYCLQYVTILSLAHIKVDD